MIVAGVDGCRAGWVVATADERRVADVRVVPAFAGVLHVLDDGVGVIAVDMPVGLPDRGARACDRAARRLLGPRRSSVFPAPPRPLLGIDDYPTALDRKRELDGTGLSKQAFFLLPKIAEVDAALDPALQRRVVESHPELAFARLAGHPLDTSKRSGPGLAERAQLLEHALGPLPDRPRGADHHDLLDAVALTRTALRLADGEADRLGDGARDARGLVMEIAW